MHYGCRTGVVLKMQLSLELLTLEMGISSQPLQESYKRYGPWITAGWFKSIWEKVDMFGIKVEVCNIPLLQPRKRDMWNMMELKYKKSTQQKIYANLIGYGCTNMSYSCQMFWESQEIL